MVGVLVWVLAGGVVWTGAASFTELGTIVPENGGIVTATVICTAFCLHGSGSLWSSPA